MLEKLVSIRDRNSPTNLGFWASCLHLIRPCKNQATDCSKTRLTINVSKLNKINEFWYNRLVL
jgi:hypothetical protein